MLIRFRIECYLFNIWKLISKKHRRYHLQCKTQIYYYTYRVNAAFFIASTTYSFPFTFHDHSSLSKSYHTWFLQFLREWKNVFYVVNWIKLEMPTISFNLGKLLLFTKGENTFSLIFFRVYVFVIHLFGENVKLIFCHLKEIVYSDWWL